MNTDAPGSFKIPLEVVYPAVGDRRWQVPSEDILKSKVFDPEISWMEVDSADRFIADPFLLKTADGHYRILFEDYSFSTGYGHIAELK